MGSRIKAYLRRIYNIPLTLACIRDAQIEREYAVRTANAKNPLAKYGFKMFSQSDEDGLIQEFARRLGIEAGTYCEYGVGDGRECNSLALAARGWRGFWISGQEIAFSTRGIDYDFFRFDKAWVNHNNIVDLYKRNATALGIENVDILSFDLDSNDLFFVDALLSAGINPKLFIVEYNAKFAPPILWSTKHTNNFVWQHTDYFGASLQSFVEMFKAHGYRLICCNAATGANAFFVRQGDISKFPEVPERIEDIFIGPYYRLLSAYGHAIDPRTVERLFEIGQGVWKGERKPEHG